MRTMGVRGALALVVCLAGLGRGDITVTSPNGGEAISANGQWLITWRCDDWIDRVRLEYSFTNGVFWESIVETTSRWGQGSYLWKVPSLSSPQCLIRITAIGSWGGADQSDATFTIFPCALRLDYDGDCAVTFRDLAALAQEWLRCGDPYDPACLGNRPPRIVSSPPGIGAGTVYTYDVKAVDADGDNLAYELLRAPAGMGIDPISGRLTWTRSADTTVGAAVIIQVRDGAGATDLQAFELGGGSLPGVPPSQQTFTGAPVNGYPGLFERRFIVYTNAVRMAPQQYRDKYMADYQPSPSSILLTHDAVEPVYLEPRLNESARSHAQDMAASGCFSHNSCDGTIWYERIYRFYPQARAFGENIAMGYQTAKATVDALLCDETGGQCAGDWTSAAGHRTNIMNSDFRQVGAGYAPGAGSTWRRYWVQDFASNEPAARPPIVAGCHDFLVSGKTTFLLNYRDLRQRAPTAVQVVVDGVAHAMSLDLGAPAAGTYRLDLSKGATCREYYFTAATGSGDAWRYPGPGVFLTDGEGSCSGDYR